MKKKGIFEIKKTKICKGDEVVVIHGKDKKKKGIVKSVFTKKNFIIVEGLNKFKKALKIGNGNNEHFVERERPIFLSKVKVIKKADKKSSKGGFSSKKKTDKNIKNSLKKKVKG